MPDDQVKKAEFYGGGKLYEHASVAGIDYLRDEEGIWRYADSLIPVPGARDLTLTERFRPKWILAEDSTVERVVVSGQSILDAPDLLGWCVDHGRRVEDPEEGLLEVLVPYEMWLERDRIPGALVAPEHSSWVAERKLALAEREYREAEKALDAAAEARAEVLQRHADEMTRQEARAITGLSVGRIQQLIRSEKLTAAQQTILRLIGPGNGRTLAGIQERARKRKLSLGGDFFSRRLRELEGLGLVERSKERFRLTAEGRKALAEAGAESPGSGAEAE